MKTASDVPSDLSGISHQTWAQFTKHPAGSLSGVGQVVSGDELNINVRMSELP